MLLPAFHLYGFFIGLGICLGMVAAQKAQSLLTKLSSPYRQISVEKLLLWSVAPGIIGARIYHVIDFWSFYSGHLADIVKIWQGGLGIYGAIIGGVVGILIKCHCERSRPCSSGALLCHSEAFGEGWVKEEKSLSRFTFQSFLASLDLVAFGLPIGQAVGRIGNFFNQELFGLPTTLPWGIYINSDHRPFRFQQYQVYHPLFAYEALLNVALFGLLWWLLKKKTATQSKTTLSAGTYFFLYLAGYGLIRFCLDYLRIDPWRMGILTTAQWGSLGAVIAAVVLIRLTLKH